MIAATAWQPENLRLRKFHLHKVVLITPVSCARQRLEDACTIQVHRDPTPAQAWAQYNMPSASVIGTEAFVPAWGEARPLGGTYRATHPLLSKPFGSPKKRQTDIQYMVERCRQFLEVVEPGGWW